MTFFIPPVFLFGNNANRVPHDEEKKSEYKTAAETEIKVENWRAKRIAELEEENKTLKDNVEFLHSCLDDRDKSIAIMQEENKNLKEENEALKEWVAKGMSYKNTYNDAIPRDENGFYKEVKPTC